MANIVINTTANIIDVEFNDMAEAAKIIEGSWNKSQIQEISLSISNYVRIYFSGKDHPWQVSTSADPVAGTLLIDSINGSVPQSNGELYSLLLANLGFNI